MAVKTRPKPAEVFPVSEFIREEMEERGWSEAELAVRMGGDPVLTWWSLQFMLHCNTPGLLLGSFEATQLEVAFGVSREFWLATDARWQASFAPAPGSGGPGER